MSTEHSATAIKEPPTQHKNEVVFCYPKTREFLILAMADGAHDRIDSKSWIRVRNIMGSYFTGPASLEDIGKVYGGISRERVRQIVRDGIRGLWTECSATIQQSFPLEEIPLGKPITLETRKKFSRTLGGISFRVAEALENGTRIQEIKSECALPTGRLSGIRKILRVWGVEVPYSDEMSQDYDQIIATLSDRNASDEEMQGALNQISRSFYENRCRGSENTLVLPVRNLIRQLGFHCQKQPMEPFVDRLKQSGIPVRIIEESVTHKGRQIQRRYHLMAGIHVERGAEVLMAAKGLKTYLQDCATLVCGVDSQPPLFGDLESSKYIRVSDLLAQYGLRFGRYLLGRMEDIYSKSGCSAPIYKKNSTYFLRASDEDIIRQAIEGFFRNNSPLKSPAY